MRKTQVQASFEAFSQEYFYAATAVHVSGGIKRPNVMFQLGGIWFDYCPVRGQVFKTQARDVLTFSTPQAVIAYLGEMEAMKSLDPNYRHKHA